MFSVLPLTSQIWVADHEICRIRTNFGPAVDFDLVLSLPCVEVTPPKSDSQMCPTILF